MPVSAPIYSLADEHRSHAEAVAIESRFRRFDKGWMIGEAQIIIGTEIKHFRA